MPRPKQLSLLPENEVVVKSNRFVTAKYDWSTLEHRIIALMISQLSKDVERFGVQTIRVRDLVELSASASKDIYNRVEEICSKLLAQKIEVRSVTDDGRREYEGYNLMSSCKYVEGSGYILAKFNEDMRSFLLELKRRFTMYRLQFVMQLRSQYSIRLYELIKMREDLKFIRMTIQELREVLCLEHKYTRSFSSLRTNVLEKARRELKETCDVYFTYHIEREGRTPVRIDLMIHSNDEVEAALGLAEAGRIEAEGPRPRMKVKEGGGAEAEASKKAGGHRRRALLRRVKPEKASGKPQRQKAARRSAAVGLGEGVPAAPRVDGFQLFLAERTQEELEQLGSGRLEAMRKQAELAAEEQHPDASSSYIASEVFRLLTRQWEETGQRAAEQA